MRADEESFEKQAGMEVGARESLSVSRLLDCMISYILEYVDNSQRKFYPWKEKMRLKSFLITTTLLPSILCLDLYAAEVHSTHSAASTKYAHSEFGHQHARKGN